MSKVNIVRLDARYRETREEAIADAVALAISLGTKVAPHVHEFHSADDYTGNAFCECGEQQ